MEYEYTTRIEISKKGYNRYYNGILLWVWHYSAVCPICNSVVKDGGGDMDNLIKSLDNHIELYHKKLWHNTILDYDVKLVQKCWSVYINLYTDLSIKDIRIRATSK